MARKIKFWYQSGSHISRCFFAIIIVCILTFTLSRVRPTTSTMAWAVNTTERTLKLLPEFTKTNANQPNGFHYDEVLTGTPNKPIYNAAARSHVYAAMDGYNSVIFAYGQTASGKTFTLVSTLTSVYIYYPLVF